MSRYSVFSSLLFLIVPLVFVACSSDAAEEKAQQETKQSNTSTEDEEGLNKGVFYEDAENGCSVYVSVSKRFSNSPASAATAAWEALKKANFDVCDVGDPMVLGVMSVYGLDSYDQPDWSNTNEHYYFNVTDWDIFKSGCESEENAAKCYSVLAGAISLEE